MYTIILLNSCLCEHKEMYEFKFLNVSVKLE